MHNAFCETFTNKNISNITQHKEMAKTNEYYICTPENYEQMRHFIGVECDDANSRWIYDLVANPEVSIPDEDICLYTSTWVLVKNRHYGPDLRFLIIFRNTSLKTIRDLREIDIPILIDAHKQVSRYLHEHNLSEYIFYFHYLPSVFQLHMHVNKDASQVTGKPNDRIQHLSAIIQNLKKNSNYYAQALILTKYCKTRHRAEIHEKRRSTI